MNDNRGRERETSSIDRLFDLNWLAFHSEAEDDYGKTGRGERERVLSTAIYLDWRCSCLGVTVAVMMMMLLLLRRI